jgi:hypothetical protein
MIGFLIALYGISGVISLIAYFPTIKDLLAGIPSANFTTYFLRFIYYAISVLYGIFVLSDWLFILVSCLDAGILLFITLLIVRVKKGEIKAKYTGMVSTLKKRKRTPKAE